MSRIRNNSTRLSKSSSELSDALTILSESSVDITNRKLFLKRMTNQLCSTKLNDAIILSPIQGPPGSTPTRDEIEAWIGALNSYTNYLSSLLSEEERNYEIECERINGEYEYSSEVSNEVNANEAIQVLIERARNSPKSNIKERATQTLGSPNEKSTQTYGSPNEKSTQTPSPKREKFSDQHNLTTRNRSSPKRSSPLSKSQPSRQSRATEASPPRDAQVQTKSLLAERIENSPRFLSYNDPIESDSSSVNCNNGGSPKHTVYIISPKKREAETQTFENDDFEFEDTNRSWKRTLSPTSSKRKEKGSHRRYLSPNQQ